MDIKKLTEEIGFERQATVYAAGGLPSGRIDTALKKLALLCEQDITSFTFAAVMRDSGGQSENSAPIMVSMAGGLEEILECLDALATNVERVIASQKREEGGE